MLETIEHWLTFKPNSIDHGQLSTFKHSRFSFGETHQLVLDGALIPSSSNTVVLFIHGNRHNITRFGEHYALCQSLGHSCFTFDFPGYGKSAGTPTESNVYASAHAAHQYLKNTLGYSDDKIIIYGCSLGGAIAIELAQHIEARCLITESTFTNTIDMARHLYPWLPITNFLTKRFDNQSKVNQISMPHLIIHGNQDNQVPITMAHRLHQAASTPKKVITVQNAGHTDALVTGGAQLAKQIQNFIDQA